MVLTSGNRVNLRSSEGESCAESDNIWHEFKMCGVRRFHSQGEQEIER